jgi:hypothetical protein
MIAYGSDGLIRVNPKKKEIQFNTYKKHITSYNASLI